MRYMNHLLLLISLSTTLASPIRTENSEIELKEIETPQNLHLECDMSDPKCRAINNSGFHSVNEFEGHLGRQAGIIANTGSKVASDEDQEDLSNTLRENGPIVQHDLQGRMDNEHLGGVDYKANRDGSAMMSDKDMGHELRGRAHSEMNHDLKKVGDTIYPDEGFERTGEGTEKQGQAGEHVGEGGHDVTKEAHRQFNVISHGCQYHCDEFIDGVVNEIEGGNSTTCIT